MKSRPKSGHLLKPYDPVVKDYKMYKAGKFWRFAFTMFAGAVLTGGTFTSALILPTTGSQVVEAADETSTVEEVYNKSFLDTLKLTNPNATTSVDGQIIVTAGVREVQNGDTTKKYLAYDQPITVTFKRFSKIGAIKVMGSSSNGSILSSILGAIAGWVSDIRNVMGGGKGSFQQDYTYHLSNESEMANIDAVTQTLLHGTDDEVANLKTGDLFRMAPLTDAGLLKIGTTTQSALDKPSMNYNTDATWAAQTFETANLFTVNKDDNSSSLTVTLTADQVKAAFADHGGYLMLWPNKALNDAVITDLIIPSVDGDIGDGVKVDVGTPTTGSTGDTGDTGDTGETTTPPITDGFPVTYKYIDENGQEIPDSTKTIQIAKDGTIDYTPQDAPAGYEFDPAKTQVTMPPDAKPESVAAAKTMLQTSKTFAGVTNTMSMYGLDSAANFIEFGSDGVTITYQGKKTQGEPVTVNFINAADPSKPIKQAVTLTGTIGDAVDFSSINKSIHDWTLTEDGTTTPINFTDKAQTVDLKYTQNTHKLFLNLVDNQGNPVKNKDGVSTIRVGTKTYTAGTGVSTKGYNYTVPGYQIQPNQSLTQMMYATTADGDQYADVYFDKIPTATVTINLKDQATQQLVEAGNKLNTYSYTGPIGEAIDFATLNIDKDITGYELVKDNTLTPTVVADNTTIDILYKN